MPQWLIKLGDFIEQLLGGNGYDTSPQTADDPDFLFPDWLTPQHAYHNTRVLCDKSGLAIREKNLICAVIYQESRFNNEAINHNKDLEGNITSTDYYIVQCNDYFHIGKGKDFPSVQWVHNHPQMMVQWMIDMYLKGKIELWDGYKSGAYKYWLMSNSPMWKLSSLPAQAGLS